MSDAPVKLVRLYPYPREDIPAWCRLPLTAHEDGLGGCWTISMGFLRRDGEQTCKGCPYYGPSTKGTDR